MTLDKLDHKMTSFQVLVGKNQGSAQNRSRFWTCALPCDFCLDSPVMTSAVKRQSGRSLLARIRGAPRTDRGSGLARCRATFTLIHLSCHQPLTPMLQPFALDNLDHKAILVGEKKGSEKKGSAQNWTCALKCHFCLDSPIMPSAVRTDAATCGGESQHP